MTDSVQGASPSSRYFYTDPLAAAWMAKHFGMQIRIVDETDDEYPWIDLRNPQDVFVFDEPRFYIHPDSLHLLEPTDGDVIQCQCSGDLREVSEACNFANQVAPEEASAMIQTRYTIIQRNGIPFHWPQREAA